MIWWIMTQSSDIHEFSGEHRWLSNFWILEEEYWVWHLGVKFRTVEHAYQFAKLVKDKDRTEAIHLFASCTPGQAKRFPRGKTIDPTWNDIKTNIMQTLVTQKFQDPKLRKMLIATGNVLIVEGNTWHDNYWGACKCKKCEKHANYNHLGRIIMDVRTGIGFRQ